MPKYNLTELQLAIIDILWNRGSGTVADVQEALKPKRKLARKTVATIMGRLEKQGVLKHQVDGREFVYTPLVDQTEIRRASVKGLIDRLFGGSVPALVSFAIEEADASPAAIKEAKRLVENSRTERRKRR